MGPIMAIKEQKNEKYQKNKWIMNSLSIFFCPYNAPYIDSHGTDAVTIVSF